MKFITKKSSETGKKFAEIVERRNACFAAQKKIIDELGATKWRQAYWIAWGGISSIIFPDKNNVNKRIWKNINKSSDEWMPRLNNADGKAIMEKIKSLPTVSVNDLNQCIGFDGAPFKTIGFSSNNKDYFGFLAGEDWGIKIPKDCKEVTVTEYNQLFKENNNTSNE